MKAPVFPLILILLLLNVSAAAQKIDTDIRYSATAADDNTICYVPGNKLMIDDFKAKPAVNSMAVAITSSGFSFKAGFRNTGSKATLIITVSCNFDKNLSWMKAHAKNDYILGHEQHHFDITYLSTLVFIKKLKQAHFTIDNYKEKLNAVYTAAIKEMQELQSQYDGETKNGQLKGEQLTWDKRIETLLAESAAK
jgi:FtsZ-binding cell division protein ZapB